MKKNSNINILVSDRQLSTVIPFTIKGQDSNAIAERLNSEFGIGVRAGSFCAYNVVRNLLGIKDDSKIVAAVEKGDTSLVPGIIRASFGLGNTKDDVDRFIDAVNFIANNQIHD